MNRHAHFVRFPYTLEELCRPYLYTDQCPYEIAATVMLDPIDYENFITGFDVERAYLAEHYQSCCFGQDGVMRCVFVQHHGRKDGVLVIPDKDGYVIWAAYLPNAES